MSSRKAEPGMSRARRARHRHGPVRLAVVCAVLGCGGGAPNATISMVTPARAYSDRPLRLTIHGQGFLPSYQIDPGTGKRVGEDRGFVGRAGPVSAPVLLHEFDWLDKNTLTALMEPGLPPGPHAIEVTDPRGQAARRELAFLSLGPDTVRPIVSFEKPEPQTPVSGGVTLDVAINAWDTEPGVLEDLRWETVAGGSVIDRGNCRFEGRRDRARCDFQVVVPAWLPAGDHFLVRAVATDGAAVPNVVEDARSFQIQRPPTTTSIHPMLGGVAGGTDLVVRGSGFFPGSKVYLGGLPLLPDGGVVMNQQTIFGRTPPHAEGPVSVTVRTPIGEAPFVGLFQYAAPPQIEAILPEMGDPDGATSIRVRGRRFTPKTQIFFGDSLVGALPCEVQYVESETEISGTAPAGRGRTSVWAFDSDLGWSRLPDGFGWREP